MPSAPAGYRGRDPIPGLSAIQPRITIRRVSTVAGDAVQVDASETTWTGPATDSEAGLHPYQAPEFRWDFGDPNGSEVFPHPVGLAVQGSGFGVTANASTDQYGPEGAYVYKEPGTYPITLHVRGWNGSEMIEASTTTLHVREEQSVWIRNWDVNITGGTFTLSIGGETTAPIAHDATDEAIAAALAALPSIGAGNVRPTVNRRHFAFVGDLLGQTVPLMTIDTSGLQSVGPITAETYRLHEGQTASDVTVSEFSGEVRYYDPVDGDNANDGLTPATPKRSWTNLRLWMMGAGAHDRQNRLAYLKRGTTFDVGLLTLTLYGARNLRFASYGDPADPPPTLLVTSSAHSVIHRHVNHDPLADLDGITFTGIRFDTIDYLTHLPFAFNISQYSEDRAQRCNRYLNFTFDGCVFLGTSSMSLSRRNADIGSGFVFWGSHFEYDHVYRHSHTSHLHINMTSHMAMVGCTMAGGHTDRVFGHWIYPGIDTHSLYRWLRFGVNADGSPNRPIQIGYCFNCNARRDGIDSPFHLISECDATAASYGVDISNNAIDGFGVFDRFIVDSNAIHPDEKDDTFSATAGILAFSGAHTTIRDNWFYRCLSGSIGLSQAGAGPDSFIPDIYRNRFFQTGSRTIRLVRTTNQGRIIDNEFHVGSTTHAIEFYEPIQTDYEFNRNRYWPGHSSLFRDLAAPASYTFAAWQGLGRDLDGELVNPGWFDPANGDFRISTTEGDLIPGTISHQFLHWVGPDRLVELTWTPATGGTGDPVEETVQVSADGRLTWNPLHEYEPGLPRRVEVVQSLGNRDYRVGYDQEST